MANSNKKIFGDLNSELYENLPCHAAAANPKLLNENIEMPSLETTAPILLSNEMLYATPLRKSERSNGRSAKSSTTPTKSCGSAEGSGAVTKKVINNHSNGRSATPTQAAKKATEPGSSQPYFENTSATAGQYYEESRIRDFLKDTSQMIRKMEMHKDLQCSNFSHLARKEHFAHLVQQNVTNSCETTEKAAKFQINGMLLSGTTQAESTTNEKDENSVMGSLNSSLICDKDTELNLTGETALESIPPTAPSMADMMLDDSNLKCALNREWVLKKIALCLEQRSFLKKPVPCLPTSEFVRNGMETGEGPFFQRAAIASIQQAASSGLPQLGYLVLGANGSGKTSICYDIIEGTSGTRGLLNRRLMAFYLINSQNPECHSLSQFVRSTILHILSHSSYVIKEDVITASDSCQEKDENKEMPDSQTLDPLEVLDDNVPPIEAAESASSFQDKELEEMIISEMKLNQRVAEFCARKNTTNTPLVRQQSEPMPTDAKDIAFTTYTTHPPLLKNQPKEAVAVEQKAIGILENKTSSEKTSPVKKLTKIPMPIGKNLLKSNSTDESRAPIADSQKNEPATDKGKETTENTTEGLEKLEKDENIENTKKADEMEPTPEQMAEIQNTNCLEPISTEPLPQPLPPKSKNCRTKIADNYYEIFISNPQIMEALTIDNIEKNPDDCFKKAILFPLLEVNPPKNALLLLVDSIDENHLNENILISTLKGRGSMVTTTKSRNIAELLSNHVHLFPKWLFLVCTAKKQNKSITKMFTGFKKLTLDDLRKSHVVKDVQQYIINRLNYDFQGINLTKEIIESLNQLYIKSNGCLLYLHKVMSCIKTNFFTFREIKLIPCTLNGLYLYICQKSFNKKQYAKIRPILNILLVSTNYVDKNFVYQCMRTHNYTLNMEEFERRLVLMTNILQFNADDMQQFKIFHNSFCDWLLDVKFSTKKFVCDLNEGHVMVAMYYTLISETLCPNQVRTYLYHLIRGAEYLKTGSGNVTVDLLLILLESQTNLSDCFYTNLINCCKRCESQYKCDPNLSSFKTKVMLEKFLNHQLSQEFMQFMVDFFKPCLPTDAKTLKLLVETGVNTDNQLSFDSARIISPTLATPSDEDRSQNIDSELADLLISSERSCQNDILHKDDLKDDQQIPAVASSSKCDRKITVNGEEKLENKQQCDIFDLTFHKGKALIHILANEGNHILLERALVACKDQPIDLEIEDLNGQTALNIAARNGHVEIVQLLLNFRQNTAAASTSVDVNHADRDGWSPLRSSSWGGHTEIVKLLISTPGCDIDRADKEGRTALRAAAWSGNEDIVNILIAAGANVNSIDLQGRTSLIAASYMGHYEIVEILLENGADVNHTDLDGRNALCVAALCGSSGYSKVISSLLEHGANTDQTDNEGMSPLLVSSFEGNAEICELLLENSADPDLADHMGRTPLFAACTSGHANVVKLLLFWGCGIDCMDIEGRTVLSVAAAQGNLETVRQLLDRGLDETHRDNAGWTPLHYSAYEGNTDICVQLLDSGAKIDESDNEGKAALHLASQEGHNSVIEALLNVHVHCIDQKAHDGKTAFRLACLEGHFECVQTLLKYGCDVNAKDADARTTLYILALENKVKVVKYLLEFSNVDVNIPDSEGRTALHVAAWQGHTEMVKLLITTGNADVNAMDNEQRTPLHSCAWQGNAKVMEMLLYYNAIPDHACKQGATSLGISAQEGHEKCVKILLQFGANPFKSDHCGRTPIKLAAKSNRNNVLKILEGFIKNENLMDVNKYHPNLQLQSPDKFQEKVILPTNNSPNNGHTVTAPSINNANSLMPNATNSSHSSNFYENTMQSNCSSSLQKRKSVISSLSTGSSNDQVPSFTQQLQKHSRHHSTKNILVVPPTRQSSASNSKYGNKKVATNLADVDEYQTNIASNIQNDIFDLGCMSPLYASPPHSPSSDSSPGQNQATSNLDLDMDGGAKLHNNHVNIFNTGDHFQRDTHMRIILGNNSREVKESSSASKSSKRSGGTGNPAMRLIRNRIDSAAQLIRRTTSNSNQGSSSIGVKSSTFQWKKE